MPSFLTAVLTAVLFPNQPMYSQFLRRMYSHPSRFPLLPPLSPCFSSSSVSHPFCPARRFPRSSAALIWNDHSIICLTALPPIDPPDSSSVPDPTWHPLDWLDIGCVESGSASICLQENARQRPPGDHSQGQGVRVGTEESEQRGRIFEKDPREQAPVPARAAPAQGK